MSREPPTFEVNPDYSLERYREFVRGGAGRIHMTPDQLKAAALRLALRTRSIDDDAGRDAAMVADAYLASLLPKPDPNEVHAYPSFDYLESRAVEARDGRIRLEHVGETLRKLAEFFLARRRPKLKFKPTIQLASGRFFNFVEPEKTPLQIDDIAHALSKICRYTGHIQDEDAIYSVAQHSVLASLYVEPGHEYAALMHDAVESVVFDCSSPFKQLLLDYKFYEAKVWAAIAADYGLPRELPQAVHDIDMRMLATEVRDLMAGAHDEEEWRDLPAPLPITITPWSPREAKHAFLARYAELTDKEQP